MRIGELWRYPVKSMQGEQLERADVTARGIVGDRGWSVLDVASQRTLTARREPRLLFASARVVDESVVITLPDGREVDDSAGLSTWLENDVELVSASADVVGTYEIDLAETGDWVTWDGPAGSFHDSTRTMISLACVETFGDWEPRRFRKNVHLTGGAARAEDELVGATLTVGLEVQLSVQKLIDRCIMTTRPQPGVDRDLDVLKTINADHGGNLGIGALVDQVGAISVGDEVR